MEIILFLFSLCFGIVTLVVVLHFIGALLMLFVPLSTERQAALIQHMRDDELEWRRREAPMRAELLEGRLNEKGRALLASFELEARRADQQDGAEIVPFRTERATPAPTGPLGHSHS